MGDVSLVNFVTWFPVLSSFDQRQLQQSDHDLKQVLTWMEKDQCPTEFKEQWILGADFVVTA